MSGTYPNFDLSRKHITFRSTNLNPGIMKKVLALFAMALIILISCEKETHTPQNPFLSKAEILVKGTWQVDEVMHNISCENTHYIRNISNTTGVDYDKLRFTFKADGSGTHVDQFGATHSLSWEFVSSDKRNIKLTILDSSPVVYNWNLVEITNDAVHATVSIILEKTQVLESFRMVPL